MSIYINGKPAYEPLDVIAEAAGRAIAMRKVFLNLTSADEGLVHISFEALCRHEPFVNAIELAPGLKDPIFAVRMVASVRAVENAAEEL
ncbi:MAG: hypothetical protein RMI94_13645 [Bryobacterales bacterium]|nr:hypothetical protein [Bryobacteraceae bacterium]MDW8131589.1 hypothetical protein [Bryobacterales bacterium]